MLRVLTLATLFPDASRPVFGGFVERQTLGLAARAGVEVEVVAPIGVAPWPLSRHPRYRRFDAVPEREQWRGLTVHRPRFPLIPRAGGSTPALMARRLIPMLRALRERFAFDVIDAEFFYPDAPAAMRIGAALDVPFSAKARGGDIHIWGARGRSRRKILAAGRAAGGMLAVSEALRRDMIALGLPGDRIAIHHTGIDRAAFHPGDQARAKAALGVKGSLIVSIGTLMARKGQGLLIDALVRLPEATLILVGEGPDRAALERRASAAGVAERVRMFGSRPHAELPGLLQAADVMALPSVSEGLANAWIEALACGTPIVIADAGGAKEVVERPEAGRIVEREAGAIAAAIGETIAKGYAREAVAATVDRFSWARNTEELEAHLRKVAGE